ncbi:hypothetical protein KXS11_14585 [Plantibacter flavus]|uniref:hypothetical protein n=1 Tax=Plantibacter flavus TaxID=150123 RepID=UPI003F17A9CE
MSGTTDVVEDTRGFLARRSVRFWERAAAVLLILASVVLVFVHVPKHTAVSPIDEYMYIDYVAKVSSQGVVRTGEGVSEFAREYLACHNVRNVGGWPATHCTPKTIADPNSFPNRGITSADIYTPAYFAVTRVLAEPFILAGADLVSAARLTGMVWLALAAVVLFFALRRLRVPIVFSGSLSLMMVGSSAAFWSNTFISTDAPAMAAGAVALMLGLRARDGRGSIWWFAAATVLAAVLKLQIILPFAAIALFFILERVREVRGRPRPFAAFFRDRLVLVSFGGLVAAVCAQAAWMVIRSAIAVGDAGALVASAAFTPSALAQELFRFLPGMAEGALGPLSTGAAAIIPVGVLMLLVSGGVIGLWGASKGLSTESNIAVSTLIVAVVSAPVLAVVSAVLTGQYIALVPRYGLSLLPLALACAGMLFTPRRALRIPGAVVAVLCYVLVLCIPM